MLRTAAVFLLSALLFPEAEWQASQLPGPCTIASGPAILPDLPEASGLAVSRRDRQLLWSHNDSGHDSVLVALDTKGAVRGRVRVPIRTSDWEDISAARCASGACLYIADIGDNQARRNRIRIHRIPEPDPTAIETARPEIFDANYADGPHNAEAMFVVGTDLFIVTRDRTGALYRATLPSSAKSPLTFHRIGQLGLQSVSDAETSTDDQLVVVRNWQEAVFYRSADLVAGRTQPYRRIAIDGFSEIQGEGVAVDGEALYLASEGGPWGRAGTLRSLRCRFSD